MDDIQTLFYIVIAIFYFLSRVLKKKDPAKNKKTSRPGTENNPNPSQRRKPVTFEELLREFTEEQGGGKQPEPEAVEEEPERPRGYRSLEDDDEIKEPAKRRFADDESRRIYEESIKNAANLKENYSEDPKIGFRRYETKEEQETVGSEVAAMLQDPADAKKAIILGEILNRKY